MQKIKRITFLVLWEGTVFLKLKNVSCSILRIPSKLKLFSELLITAGFLKSIFAANYVQRDIKIVIVHRANPFHEHHGS